MEEFKVPTLPLPVAKPDDTQNKEKTIPPDRVQSSDVQVDNKKTSPASTSNCPYKIPPWSAAPSEDANYAFEVLKSGQIIEEIKELQSKATWKFGRLPENDIEMAHPTISRFHAVLQYRPRTSKSEESDDIQTKDVPPEGWYIYDLGSTHGTFLNKQQIPPGVYIRIRVGHMLKLGASTRSYILQGPAEDEEPESELSVTELREQHQRERAIAAAEARRKSEEAEERERNEGISWGMAEDADEETDLTHNPYASTNNEELFLDDPKRTLRGYFEREGIPLEYKCEEMSAGSFVCRVELPVDDSNGRPIVAEVVHKGRKKECVVQCALEACRILDRHGVLRQANQEPQRRKMKSQESDSDDDDFLDRTGDIERKKMRKASTNTTVTFTYNDLLKQEEELSTQLGQVENDILKYQETQKRVKTLKMQQDQSSDDLDNFMDNLCGESENLDKTEIRKLRLEEQRLKMEKSKVQRLIKIAKPTELPSLIATSMPGELNKSVVGTTQRQLPMIGKRNQFSKFKPAKVAMQSTTINSSKTLASDEEEVEEEEDALNVNTNEKHAEDCVDSFSSNIKTPTPESTAKEKDSNSASVAKKQYGPAVIPPEILEKKSIDYDKKIITQMDLETSGDIVKTNDLCESNTTHVNKLDREQRKRRLRQRQRYGKRQDVDIDELEEQESSEKYAKWVPPENQSGDGYTKLNEKFGY